MDSGETGVGEFLEDGHGGNRRDPVRHMSPLTAQLRRRAAPHGVEFNVGAGSTRLPRQRPDTELGGATWE
ncbi:hypothetical protein ACWGJT_24190 [Streptomyces xantholiticus]